MGSTKRALENQEARYQYGLELCIEFGAIEECENHPSCYYQGSVDLEDAYRYANAGVTKKNIPLPDRMSRRDLTDAIKEAYDDNSGIDYCPSCDKYMRD